MNKGKIVKAALRKEYGAESKKVFYSNKGVTKREDKQRVDRLDRVAEKRFFKSQQSD